MLSSTAWIVHDVGLATAIGGTVFGRTALQPGLRNISNEHERDLVADDAWRRFSWINLVAHGAMAATWFVGRTMLTGREVDRQARKLTIAKDVLVVTSLASGVGSIVTGRVLGRRNRAETGTETRGEVGADAQPIVIDKQRSRSLQRAVGALGIINLLANVGIAAVTAVLAMKANESLRFGLTSRKLP
ncbi:MAG: hypothetical protein H0T79_04875 [Deltaproteobacteria bacterium]|nr:hypothetical protein [Deltaproteobacteria bacterium]